jgi:hypothetical protein
MHGEAYAIGVRGLKLDRQRRHCARIGASALLNVVIAIVLIGCGQPKSSNQPKIESPEKPSGPVLTLDPETTGAITGTVKIEGNLKQVTGILSPCGKGTNASGPPPPPTETKAEPANIVIYLKSGLGNYHFDTPTNPVSLDQQNCTYQPHVLALMVNQPLQIENSDPVAHNIHVLSKVNPQWNHSEPAGVAPIMESFSKPELAIHVICKLHPGMSAYVFVFDNPYYAVTSSSGTFNLKNVPPGTYTVEAWQQQLGTQNQTVTIAPKEAKALSFVFKSGGSSGD